KTWLASAPFSISSNQIMAERKPAAFGYACGLGSPPEYALIRITTSTVRMPVRKTIRAPRRNMAAGGSAGTDETDETGDMRDPRGADLDSGPAGQGDCFKRCGRVSSPGFL